MMKNAFYVILKDLSVRKIFKFLTNISRSKGNQTMKLGQLIAYNKRNFFLQKLCGKSGRETSLRTSFYFLKKLKWSAA